MEISFLQPWFLLAAPVLFVFFLLAGRRKLRGLKGRVSLILRICAAVFLCLALAGTSFVMRSSQKQIIVLADRSQSMRGSRAAQEAWVRDIESALPPHYDLSVVSFGEDAQVEKAFGGAGFMRFQKQLRDGETDFEQAMRFSSSTFSNDAAKQVFLMTDGRDTLGDVEQVTSLLKTQGIRVDTLVFEQEAGSDAQVNAVKVSDTIYQNETFDVHVEVESEVEKKATLLLYGGATLLSSREVHLQKGGNSFVFQDVAQTPGMVSYRAVLQEDEGAVQNNEKSAVTKVIGTPHVLVVEGGDGQGEELRKMLDAVAIQCTVSPVGSMPKSTAAMQKYDAVAMVNVSAEDCTADQINALDNFVKTLGRGLVLFGGDNSYALGSYIGSDLEAMLPVESNVRSKLDMPSLALVMAIDHSGSMSDDGGSGVTLLDLAKESAQRAVELLVPQDEVGIVAFDDTSKWVAPLQSAQNAGEIIELIGGLQPGGGTMMYFSIDEAYKALQQSDAAIKHVILLTDGQPADSGFEGLVSQMRDESITVSGVAVGAGANTRLMQQLSTLGGGRYYQVDATDNIPAIFAKETQLSTQSYLQNREFYPEYASSSPLTRDFSSGMPRLTGFLGTIAKPTATVALQSDNGLPILAHWQYGAGQVVAWTSDVQGVWSESFLSWPDAPAFFGGFLGNVLQTESGQGFLEVTQRGGSGRVDFSVEGMDQAATEATVIAPDGQETRVPLHLEKPGRFAADFPLDQEGVYVVKVDQTQDGATVNSVEGGLAKGYSAEFDIRLHDQLQAVSKLRAAGGGSEITAPEQLFENPPEPRQSKTDLTVVFLVIGLLLFMLDIAARRLQWEARAVALATGCKNAVASVFRRRPKRAPKGTGAAQASPVLSAPAAQAAPAETAYAAAEAAAEAAPPGVPAADAAGAEQPSPKRGRAKKKKEAPSSMSSELLARRRDKKP